jgi:trimeric autotransporter adhesin
VAVAGNGDLYILDQGNQRVLWVPNPDNYNALNYRVAGPYVGNSGDPRSTQLMNPRYVLAAPDGALLVADSDRSVVRRIEPDGGFADVIAGTGNKGGFFDDDNGAATSIPLGWPTGLALGPDGSLYIADRGRHMIFRLQNGQISRFAGTGRADFLHPSGYSAEGRPAREESLYSPGAVAVDPQGNVYIADTLNSRIRKVDTNGTMTTLAGTGAYGYNGDGKTGIGTQLFQPGDVAWRDGAVYFADSGNAVIRKFDPVTSIVTIVAGSGGRGGFGGDGGPATAAVLNGPDGFTFGPDGSMYIADTQNSRVRKVAPDGTISTIAGTGTNGETGDGGAATAALLRGPRSVSVDAQGNVFVADTENNRIRMIAPGGAAPTPTPTAASR